MKKLFFLLFFLIPILAAAQVYLSDNTFGKVLDRQLVRRLQGIPKDTFAVIPQFQNDPHIAAINDTTLYLWGQNNHKWNRIIGGGGGGVGGVLDSIVVLFVIDTNHLYLTEGPDGIDTLHVTYPDSLASKQWVVDYFNDLGENTNYFEVDLLQNDRRVHDANGFSETRVNGDTLDYFYNQYYFRGMQAAETADSVAAFGPDGAFIKIPFNVEFIQQKADWNAEEGPTEIVNKPTLLSQFENDLTDRYVTGGVVYGDSLHLGRNGLDSVVIALAGVGGGGDYLTPTYDFTDKSLFWQLGYNNDIDYSSYMVADSTRFFVSLSNSDNSVSALFSHQLGSGTIIQNSQGVSIDAGGEYATLQGTQYNPIDFARAPLGLDASNHLVPFKEPMDSGFFNDLDASILWKTYNASDVLQYNTAQDAHSLANASDNFAFSYFRVVNADTITGFFVEWYRRFPETKPSDVLTWQWYEVNQNIPFVPPGATLADVKLIRVTQKRTSYLTGEIDPIYTASYAAGITGTNISNWDAAYGWGNHADAGYATTTNALLKTANLSDLPNAATARTNLGLGTAATTAATAYATASHTHAISNIAALQDSLNKRTIDSVLFRGLIAGTYNDIASLSDSSGFVLQRPNGTKDTVSIPIYSGPILTAYDIEISTIGKGVIMKSPNGNRWRLTVSDAGAPVFTLQFILPMLIFSFKRNRKKCIVALLLLLPFISFAQTEGIVKYEHIAALKSATVAQGTIVFVSGKITAGDGMGGFYRWDSTQNAAEDTTFLNQIKSTGQVNGLWVRLFQRARTIPGGVFVSNGGILTYFTQGTTDASGKITLNLTNDNTATGTALFSTIYNIHVMPISPANGPASAVQSYLETITTKTATYGFYKANAVTITLGLLYSPFSSVGVGTVVNFRIEGK